MKRPLLVITPSVPVWQEDGNYIFDRKFYDGLQRYIIDWEGEIRCVFQKATSIPPAFGLVYKNSQSLNFDCVLLDQGEKINRSHLFGAKVVLASGDSYYQFHVVKLCKKIGVKCIYIIEYILETRLQIAALSTSNWIVRMRRYFFVWNGERKRKQALSLADGIQANGTAAYVTYQKCNNPMLYFDTRVSRKHIISKSDLTTRLNYLKSGHPLRLAFSGRLIVMKGVDHLIRLAKLVNDRGIDFTMSIFGSGELENDLHMAIQNQNLESKVFMRGVLEFNSELLPEIKKNVDIYIVPHRQSDPSCTYLETLSCGIPILGYNNRAFAGILMREDVGWAVQMNAISEMADQLFWLNNQRQEVVRKSLLALSFASEHDFERTFHRRMAHIESVL